MWVNKQNKNQQKVSYYTYEDIHLSSLKRSKVFLYKIMAIQVKNRLVGRRNSHVISHKSHPRFDPWWANMFFENMIIKPSICLWLDWKGMIKHDLNICFFGLARFLLVTRGWHKIKKEINLIWVHYVLYFKQPKGKVYRINSCGGNEYSHQSFPAKKSFFHTSKSFAS